MRFLYLNSFFESIFSVFICLDLGVSYENILFCCFMKEIIGRSKNVNVII